MKTKEMYPFTLVIGAGIVFVIHAPLYAAASD